VEPRCSRVSPVLEADARAGQGRFDAKVEPVDRHLAGKERWRRSKQQPAGG